MCFVLTRSLVMMNDYVQSPNPVKKPPWHLPLILPKKLKINFQLHEYHHDANSESYGLEAAEKLQVEAKRVFKTLVVQDDNDKLAVAILPVEHLLNLKKIAKAIGA